MKIASAQMQMTENPEENLAASLQWMEKAAAEDADLILFPEIQLTTFFPRLPGQNRDEFAISIDHPFVEKIRNACRRLRLYASPNFYIRDGGKYFDSSLLIDNSGAIIGRQDMVHIAQAEGFYEQDYYTPSEDGFHVFSTPLGNIGIVVCFDRHYPESIRTEALMGADLILIPTANTAAEPDELFQWEVKVQAFQNSTVIAMCNRTGIEGDVCFNGHSIIAGCDGETLALAGEKPQLLYAEIKPENSRRRRREKPYTSLRRKEFYL